MIEFVQVLGALVAFLLPLGTYFLILASINRRTRPVIVSGTWDAIGLLFAVSGFLLVTMPVLMTELYKRTSGASGSVIAVWISYWLVWLAYFLMLIAGSALMVLMRGDKTLIYNVDIELFAKILDQSLALIGLEGRKVRDRLVVSPMGPPTGDSADGITETPKPMRVDDRRHAELTVDSFPTMCHVTLHWGSCTPDVRREIERELHRNLESAAPMENPAAGWFLSVSGMVLGAVTAIVCAMVFLIVISLR